MQATSVAVTAHVENKTPLIALKIRVIIGKILSAVGKTNATTTASSLRTEVPSGRQATFTRPQRLCASFNRVERAIPLGCERGTSHVSALRARTQRPS